MTLKDRFCPSVISQGDDRWNFVSLNPFPLSHILKWKKESSTLSNLFRSPYQVRFFCFSLLFKSKNIKVKEWYSVVLVFRHLLYYEKQISRKINTFFEYLCTVPNHYWESFFQKMDQNFFSPKLTILNVFRKIQMILDIENRLWVNFATFWQLWRYSQNTIIFFKYHDFWPKIYFCISPLEIWQPVVP